jgi:hypothetical protein
VENRTRWNSNRDATRLAPAMLIDRYFVYDACGGNFAQICMIHHFSKCLNHVFFVGIFLYKEYLKLEKGIYCKFQFFKLIYIHLNDEELICSEKTIDSLMKTGFNCCYFLDTVLTNFIKCSSLSINATICFTYITLIKLQI